MRLITAILTLVLLPMAVFPQSYWLDSHQSGVFFEPEYARATDINSRGLALGYASNGRADFGFSFSKTTQTVTYIYDPYDAFSGDFLCTREVKYESWTTSQFFLGHLYKAPHPSKDCLTLSLSILERFSFLGESLLPKSGSLKFLTLGQIVALRIKPISKLGCLLSGGYLRTIPLESGVEAANTATASVGWAFYGSRVITALYFEYARSEGINSYGISLSLGQINQKTPHWP